MDSIALTGERDPMMTSYARQLKEYAEANPSLVSVKTFTDYPELRVLKYKNRVFYRNLWNDMLVEMRGTVVDAATWEPVIRSPTKMFNYGERNTRIDRDEAVMAVDKINGFMATATIYKGKILVGTTGSLDSPFTAIARKWLEPLEEKMVAICNHDNNITYTFEIVDPSDPHIIPETAGAYLLTVRDNRWGAPQNKLSQQELDELAEFLQVKRPIWHRFPSFQALKDFAANYRREGFVVYGEETGKMLKIKSPFYLATKFIGRMSDERLISLLDNPQEFKKTIDEEFYGIIDHLSVDLNIDYFVTLDKQGRIDYVRNFFFADDMRVNYE